MVRTIEGQLSGNDLKIAIVISRFNDFITKSLLSGALDCLRKHGTRDDAITVVWTTGSLEIPMTAKRVLEKNVCDGIICLGAVIRGATHHFEIVANQSASGIAALALQSKIPIINGIITCDTIEHAIERAGTKAGNKGWDAAICVIEAIHLFKQL